MPITSSCVRRPRAVGSNVMRFERYPIHGRRIIPKQSRGSFAVSRNLQFGSLYPERPPISVAIIP